MSYLKVYKEDLRILLSLAMVLPVVCFATGYFIGGNSSNKSAWLASQFENLPKRSLEKQPLIQVAEKESLKIKAVSKDSPRVYDVDNKASEIKSNQLVEENVSLMNGFKDYLIQAGRFSTFKNAKMYQTQLKKKKIDTQIVSLNEMNDQSFILVLTSFNSKVEAKKYSLHLEKLYQIDLYVRFQEKTANNKTEVIASI